MVPVLSVLPRVVQSQFIEQGLYVVAFHPQFSENGYFFVDYASVRLNGSGVIARFQLDPHSPDHVRLERIAATEKHILTIEQPSYNNNSGQVAFGPDGLLYVGVGDGGWKAPRDAGQDASLLLGSILRIDINTKDNVAYKIPANNSLIGKPGRVHQEIWAHGFHRATSNTSCDVTGNLPVALYPHPKVGAAPKAHDSGFVCASAQGLGVANYPGMQGVYLLADWCTGQVFGTGWDGDRWQLEELIETSLHITAGGQDEAGHVLAVSVKFYDQNENRSDAGRFDSHADGEANGPCIARDGLDRGWHCVLSKPEALSGQLTRPNGGCEDLCRGVQVS